MSAELRELRSDIRHWRRGRVDTSLLEAVGDAYVNVFAGLLLTSMVVSVVVNVRLVSDDLCGGGCAEARAVLPWLVGLAALAGVLACARLFGPVFVSPAVGSWLLSAPLDRSAVLRPRLLWPAVVAAPVAGAVTAAAVTLGGFGLGPLLALTVSVGALGLAAVAFAALSQTRGGTAARVLTWALAACVWTGLLGITLGIGPTSTPDLLPSPAWVAVGAVVALAVALLVVAVSRVGRLGRHDVSPGGSLAPGLSGALATLDLALVYDVLLAHRWNSHASVRPRRGGPSGLAALVWCDLSRLRRSPQTLVVLAAAVVVPYAAESAGSGRVVLLLTASAGFVAGLPLLAGLRVLTRTPSLVRALPFPAGAARRSTLVVPVAAMAIFGLASAPALHATLGLPWFDSLEVAVAVGGCALAASVRWVTGRPPDYSRPLVSTPAGAVPTNLYGSVVRGVDILLLTAAPLLFSPTVGGALVSLALTFGVVSYLAGRE